MSVLKTNTFVAIDLETTGKYPMGDEICELAMIKFNADGVIATKQTLVRPLGGMSKIAFGVHGISLEMLKDSPLIQDVIGDVLDFIDGAPLVAHNIPFDLGFLLHDIEEHAPESVSKLSPVNFCTSLISLSMYPKLTSHRLQYLTQYFELKDEPNHRAMQDTQSCLDVFKCLVENVKDLEELENIQGTPLNPESFSIKKLVSRKPELLPMVKSCKTGRAFDLMYSKGSQKNKWRELEPKGLVLKQNSESFLVACDPGDVQTKRFMIDKILDSKLIK